MLVIISLPDGDTGGTAVLIDLSGRCRFEQPNNGWNGVRCRFPLRGCAKIASYHSKARSRSATAARDVESCGIRTFRWTIEQEISIWFSAEDCRVAVAQRVGGAG